MRKYFNKQTIVAFILGAMISVVPISAAIEEFICYRADYKVVINDVEYISADLPVLNYKGNTYAPFRSILEKAGLNVDWNTELGQAEVTSNPTSAQINNVEGNTMTTTIEYDSITGLPFGATYVENEKDGRKYKTIFYNGKTYISTSDLRRFFEIDYVRMSDDYSKAIFKSENETQIIVPKVPGVTSIIVGAYVYEDTAPFQEYLGE